MKEQVARIEDYVPEEFLKECPEVVVFDGTDLADLAENYRVNVENYIACKERHNGWVRLHKEKQKEGE